MRKEREMEVGFIHINVKYEREKGCRQRK